jgi:hypothetical protein
MEEQLSAHQTMDEQLLLPKIFIAAKVIIAILVVIGITFQVVTIQYMDKEVEMEVLKESRSLWMGGIGVFPLVLLIVLLSLGAVALTLLSRRIDNMNDKLLGALATLTVRVSRVATTLVG